MKEGRSGEQNMVQYFNKATGRDQEIYKSAFIVFAVMR